MAINTVFGGSALAALLSVSGGVPSGVRSDTVSLGESHRTWHMARGTAGPERTPAPDEVLRRAMLELAIGASERARGLLERYPLPPESPLALTALRVFAAAAYADDDFATAARYFAAAAGRAGGVRRGVLEARAAEAFERAGLLERAAIHYRAAARRLPGVSGWIAIRLARLTTDTARAFELLGRAPSAARSLAVEVRAQRLAAAGDWAHAASELAAAGFNGQGASLALAAGDRARARRLAYAALAGADTAEALVALDLLAGRLPPRNRDQSVTIARALARRGRSAEAAQWFKRTVAAGDSSPATLLAWGAALEASRDRRAALRTFALAGGRGEGPDAASAQFARGRLLLRIGRRAAGLAALTTFARAHADHLAAPAALMEMADARSDAGDRRRADSLYQEVTRRWPESLSASQARFRLAGHALQLGDAARARSLYAAVVQDAGPDAPAARYVLARLARKHGDTLTARLQWTSLAHDDPLGYYGMLARQAAGLSSPSFRASGATLATPEVSQAIATLSLLDAIGFDAEAELVVGFHVAQEGYSAEQVLELAGGLLGRGRTGAAASLGWRAARHLSLEDPRVLRVIFPWPWRRMVEAEAQEFGIDPYLLAGLIRQESGFRRAAISRAGAWGLMQLMPGTAALTASRLGVEWRHRLLTVPDANIHLGAAHLSMLLRRFRGTVVAALAAYNAGGRPVERWARLPNARDPFWFVERIPYPETRGYVRSVLRNRALYAALYPPVATR